MTLPRMHVDYKVNYTIKEANSPNRTNASTVVSLLDPPSTEEIKQALRRNRAVPENAEIMIISYYKD